LASAHTALLRMHPTAETSASHATARASIASVTGAIAAAVARQHSVGNAAFFECMKPTEGSVPVATKAAYL